MEVVVLALVQDTLPNNPCSSAPAGATSFNFTLTITVTTATAGTYNATLTNPAGTQMCQKCL